MAAQDDPAIARESPVLLELLRLDVGSAVAVVGHPIHVMMVHFPIAFLLVRGIRVLEASWSHAVAAMTLVAIAGASWGLRLTDPQSILPHGLALSGLAAVMTAFAGWHGGKLVFDHGVGILVTPKN